MPEAFADKAVKPEKDEIGGNDYFKCTMPADEQTVTLQDLQCELTR